jgi:oxygen-dependent protoporphyrinogen oxidase
MRHLWAARVRDGKRKRARIMSYRGGLEALPKALAEALGHECIRTSCRVEAIGLKSGSVQVSTDTGQHEGDRLILALPAQESARLIHSCNVEASRLLQALPGSALGVLHLAFDRKDVKHALDGFGFLWKPQPGRSLLGALFSSSLFVGRAPSGKVLLTCMCGGGVNPGLADVRDEKVQRGAIESLLPLIGAKVWPEVLRATYWERAIPSYPLGHFRLLEEVSRLESQYRQLRFLGNWRDGISIADCVAAARKMAAETV